MNIHTDQLNTPRLITDSNGNAVWQWGQDEPFGDTLPNQDPNGTGTQFVFNLRFGGSPQYYDAETGLTHNGRRDYDSLLGIFYQSDPIGLAGGQASTYAYVGGNPLKFIDPQGLTIWDGDYHSRCLIEGVGSCETTYTLTSECVDGKRQVITVEYIGPGAGAGIPKLATSESSGTISFNDHQPDVNSNNFSGSAGDVSIGFNLGTWGPSYNRTRLGKAYSTGSGGESKLWD